MPGAALVFQALDRLFDAPLRELSDLVREGKPDGALARTRELANEGSTGASAPTASKK